MERLMERKSLSKKYELLGMNARATVPGCYVKPFAEKIAALVVGGTAPDLRMQTPEGDSLSIYGVKAKAKIIHLLLHHKGLHIATTNLLFATY